MALPETTVTTYYVAKSSGKPSYLRCRLQQITNAASDFLIIILPGSMSAEAHVVAIPTEHLYGAVVPCQWSSLRSRR